MKLKKVCPSDSYLLQEIIKLEKILFKEGGLNIWAIQPLAEYQMIYGYIDSNVSAYAIFLSKVDDAETIYLFSFGVVPEMQGKRIGKSFLDDLILEMKGKGYSKLELTVSSNNKVALHLYNSTMKKLSTTFIKGCYGDGEDRQKIIFKI